MMTVCDASVSLILLISLPMLCDAGSGEPSACHMGNVSVSVVASDAVTIRSLSFDQNRPNAPMVLQSAVHCRPAHETADCDAPNCRCPCDQPLLNADGSYLEWISSSLVQCNGTLLLIGLGLGELLANSAARCGHPVKAAAVEADATIALLAGRFGYTRGVAVFVDPHTAEVVRQLSHHGFGHFDLAVVDCFVGAVVPPSCRSEGLLQQLRSISTTVVQNMYQEDNTVLLAAYKHLWPEAVAFEVGGNTLIIASTDHSIFEMQDLVPGSVHFVQIWPLVCVTILVLTLLLIHRRGYMCCSKRRLEHPI